MDRLRNTSERFGVPAIALHWAMALLLIGLIASGLVMARMPDVGFDSGSVAPRAQASDWIARSVSPAWR